MAADGVQPGSGAEARQLNGAHDCVEDSEVLVDKSVQQEVGMTSNSGKADKQQLPATWLVSMHNTHSCHRYGAVMVVLLLAATGCLVVTVRRLRVGRMGQRRSNTSARYRTCSSRRATPAKASRRWRLPRNQTTTRVASPATRRSRRVLRRRSVPRCWRRSQAASQGHLLADAAQRSWRVRT